MLPLDQELQQRLDQIDGQHLRRSLLELGPAPNHCRIQDAQGRSLLSFASNDYLGLARHPKVREAAATAAEHWGAGSAASRLICGSLGIHHELERALARFKGREAALAFSSGYQTATGVIPALVGSGDLILLDRLAHSCLVEGARRSGATLRVFRHNDVGHLKALLSDASDRVSELDPRAPRNTLIVTESVFSMDGDVAPLRAIAELRNTYGGWLMVDEAHATGVLGPQGRGVVESEGVNRSVDILMGTLGKSLGSAGGFVAGSKTLCDYLINQTRTFIFSTAPSPATAGAALAALEILASAEGDARRATLTRRLARLHEGLLSLNWPHAVPTTAILPLHIGAESDALRLASALRAEGILVPAVRYPTVKRGQARLRLTVSADHTAEDVDELLAALKRCLAATGVRPGTCA